MFNFFIPLIIFFSSTISIFASDCNQNCGSATVPYPFGFSSNCKVPLTCSIHNTISIEKFPVLNITSSSIFLNVSPSCNRTVLDSVSGFFSNNFALKKSNGLFLRGCNSSSFEKCSISTALISDRLDILNCGDTNDNVSCFARVTKKEGNFITKEEIIDTGCRFLYSSVAYKAEQSLTALIFSEVELEWWMDGKCNCSDHANCTAVISPVTKGSAYTCQCYEGFVGDGFKSGRGCSKGGRKSVRAGLLAGVITAGASITLLTTAFLTYHIKRRQNSSKTNKTTKRLLSESSFNVPFYPYKTIERATDNFSDTHRLGTGAYGTVYVGTLSNNNLIAVKKIKHPDPETISQVMNEVKMISSVNHPNLVHLLGCCIDRGEQILVYEFMPNGTLSEHLQRQRGPGLPWTIRLAIATETAKALAYLHSQVQPPIYHRDIKSSNILLDFQFNAKIADFGLSRSIMSDCSHVSTAPQGTPGYVDPQYHQNYHLSDKSDVYSFGVVLIEIISAMRVVDFNRGQTEINLAALAVDRIAKGRVEEIIDPFMNVKKDSWVFGSVHKVAELAFRCLAFHRDMRPTMVEVADELEQIRVSVWAPKDGEVELCTSPLIGREGKSKRVVFVSGRMEEEKVNSPVSVQDNWKSEQSTPSSSSLLGYPNQ